MRGRADRADTMSTRSGLLERLTAPFGDGERPYRCRDCDTAFGLRHHVCPECGCYRVERDAWQ